DIRRHPVADAREGDVDPVLAKLQFLYFETIDPDRQARLGDHHPAIAGIDLDAQARLQQHEHRAGSPRLGQTGHRVSDGRFARGALEAAVEFGQAHAELGGRFEDAAQ
nr:hypothetical protein [Tanacetum cinerariifolium]